MGMPQYRMQSLAPDNDKAYTRLFAAADLRITYDSAIRE